MANNPYRFLFANKFDDYYYIDSNGVLTTTTDKDVAALIECVVNWNEIQLSWVRNERYHGVIRKQSGGNAIEFANEAARILREFYYITGRLNAIVRFKIEVIDSTTLEYSEIYSGEIDFSTFKSKKTTVEVSIMEGGIYSIINAYENVEVEIPVSTTDAVKVLMDGITLKTRYRYVTSFYSSHIDTITKDDEDLAVGFVRQEGDLSAGFGETVVPSPLARFPMFFANYDTTAIVTIDFPLSYTLLSGSPNDSITITYIVWTDATLTTLVSSGDIYVSPIITAGTTNLVTASGTVSVGMQAGQVLQVVVRMTNSVGSTGIDFAIDDGTVIINCETQSGNPMPVDNIMYCYRWHQVFSKLITELSDGAYSAKPAFIADPTVNPLDNMDAIPYQTAIISEQALKNVNPTPVMKVKLSDMQQDAFAGFSAGVGVEGDQITVRKLDYFYQKDVVICDVGAIDDLAIMQAPQYVLNRVEVGYDDYDSVDDINKFNEFNTKQERTTSVSNVLDKSKNTLNMLRPFSAGCQTIELVRAQNVENSVKVNNTKRNDSNKNYLLYLSNIQSFGAYELKRGAVVDNVDFPEQVYNVALSPARMLKRSARYIKSILTGLIYPILYFKSSGQVPNMGSSITNTLGYLVENDHINYADAFEPAPLIFKPYIFEFTASAPRNFAQLMEANPYGVITFTYRGVQLSGFVLNAGLNPHMRQTFNFQLLCSPDVNDEDLVY